MNKKIKKTEYMLDVEKMMNGLKSSPLTYNTTEDSEELVLNGIKIDFKKGIKTVYTTTGEKEISAQLKRSTKQALLFTHLDSESYIIFLKKSGNKDLVINKALYINKESKIVRLWKDGDYHKITLTELSKSFTYTSMPNVLDSEGMNLNQVKELIFGFFAFYYIKGTSMFDDTFVYYDSISKDMLNSRTLFKEIIVDYVRALTEQDGILKIMNEVEHKGIEECLDKNKISTYVDDYEDNLVFISVIGSCKETSQPTFYEVYDKDLKRTEYKRTKDNIFVRRNTLWEDNHIKQEVTISDSALNNTNLKYKLDIVNIIKRRVAMENEDTDHNLTYGGIFYTLYEYPILEQLYKTGFKRLVLSSVMPYVFNDYELDELLENYFGKIDFSKTRLLAQLGISKDQFNYFKDMKYQSVNYVSYYKRILTGSSDGTISHISMNEIEVIGNIIDNLQELKKDPYRNLKLINENDLVELLMSVYRIWSFSGLVEVQKVINDYNYNKMMLEHYHSFVILYDDVYELIDFKFGPSIQSYEDLENRIRDLTIVSEEVTDQLNAEKFQEASKELHELEVYDEDSGYMIVVPKVRSDLAREGRLLNHCVASYSDRFMNKEKIIVFVRSIEDPVKPLYTLELSKNYKIVQFFGRYNSEPEPDAIHFVKKHLENIKKEA